jgi:two-component sensor histidine kinase
MRKIIRSRLPERLAGRVPPLLVELGVGVLVALVFIGFRVALTPVAGDRAPYAFVFLGIVIACLLAGWRSGLITLSVGQGITWLLVTQGMMNSGATQGGRLGGFITATVSQLIILLIITLYQREVARGVREQDRRMELLDQARREIDHRAKNNFQTVLSLVQLQTARETEPNAKQALQQVADRIQAISVASEHLAIRNEDLTTVHLRDHLCELCSQLERGLARGEVHVECDIPDVIASADTAIHLAIIVNELVTNSLKHAFEDGRRGLVQVRSKMNGHSLELEVVDNGIGMKKRSPSSGSGLGRKLVETFAQHLNAKVEVSSSSEGTRHRIVVPALA